MRPWPEPGELEAAKARFNVVDLVQRLGGAPAGKGGQEWLLLCPLCGKDNLAVHVSGMWHCWTCEADGHGAGRGDLVGLMSRMLCVQRVEAAWLVVQGAGPTASNPNGIVGNLEHRKVQPGFLEVLPELPLPEGWSAATGTLPYLLRRGIDPRDAALFGVGWCDRGRYAGRMVFPVYEDGRLVYFQGRAMWEKHEHQGTREFLKALGPYAPPGWPEELQYPGGVIGNLDRARCYPRVCLVEGPVDAMKVGHDAAPLFGKVLRPRHLWLLARAGVKAVDVFLDPEAWQQALAVGHGLAPFVPDVRVVQVPKWETRDPGGRTPAENAEVRRWCSVPLAMVGGVVAIS